MEYQIVKKWNYAERKAYYIAQYQHPETGEWETLLKHPLCGYGGVFPSTEAIRFSSIRSAKKALVEMLEMIRMEEDNEIVKSGRLR